MRDDIMEDYEIGIALRKEMELRDLSERYPALNQQMYTPWALQIKMAPHEGPSSLVTHESEAISADSSSATSCT